MPLALLHAVAGLAPPLITLTAFFGGTSLFRFAYLWTPVYVAWLMQPLQAGVHVAAIVVQHGLVDAFSDANEFSPGEWGVIAVILGVVAAFVAVLRHVARTTGSVLETLLARADACLYGAKAARRASRVLSLR